MSYQLLILRPAEKELRALAAKRQARLDRLLLSLCANHRPRGTKKLAGREHTYRIRAGDYRIIYEVHDDRLIVIVVRIAQRREAYR